MRRSHSTPAATATIRFTLINAGSIGKTVTGSPVSDRRFENRRDHEDARPLRTLAAQIKLSTSGLKSTDKSRVFAASLDQLAKRKELPIRFQSVAKEEKQQLTQRRQEVQKFRGERQQLETQAPPAATEKPARYPNRPK